MTFQPLHRDKKHKFKNGQWTWQPYDDVNAKLKFHSHSAIVESDKKVTEHPHDETDVGLKFSNYIDEAEEKIFLEIFARPKNPSFIDGDVITIQDIKNLTLFTASSRSKRGGLGGDFIEFLHTKIFDEFLHATIFYIEHFLLTLEFLLVRRDENLIEGKIRDLLSMQVERFLSTQLTDRRLLMAREYSKILTNRGKKFLSPEKDLIFYESLIDFATQCVYVAMHRRAFNAICEFPFHFSTSIPSIGFFWEFFQLAN
jgi:hypothetical protein